jgi:hypothetical protein
MVVATTVVLSEVSTIKISPTLMVIVTENAAAENRILNRDRHIQPKSTSSVSAAIPSDAGKTTLKNGRVLSVVSFRAPHSCEVLVRFVASA